MRLFPVNNNIDSHLFVGSAEKLSRPRNRWQRRGNMSFADSPFSPILSAPAWLLAAFGRFHASGRLVVQ
jgi:hypothetical protein